MPRRDRGERLLHEDREHSTPCTLCGAQNGAPRHRRALRVIAHAAAPLRVRRLTWTAVIGNALVIVQGAVVRVTHSGAGCGRHWPLCNGTVLPLDATTETLIEFGHRLLSLGVLIVGAWLLAAAWRVRREHPGTFAFAGAAFFFLIVEALLGAATVLLGLTADDTSVARGLMVASHLVNSLLLVGALAGTAAFATGVARWPLRASTQGPLLATIVMGLLGMLFLTFSGGIAAMGNTMFPSESLAAGLAADFDPNSHPLIRLRILHPLIAITVGVYLWLGLGLANWLKPTDASRPWTAALVVTYAAQLVVGTVNLALLAPSVLQLLHLFMAVVAFGVYAVWSLTLLGAERSVRAPRAAVRTGLENA